MKKWFIILGIMLLFSSGAYSAELSGGEKTILSNYIQSINKSLKDTAELSGTVQVYFDVKANHSLNSYKIISYDNEELAEVIDSTLKSLAKYPENFTKPKFRFIANLTAENGRIKTEIISRNYAIPKSSKQDDKIFQYYSKLMKQLNEQMNLSPDVDYMGLDDVIIELNISSIGKIKKIRLLQSSGDKNYDDKICNYFLEKTVEMPPADALKNGYYSLIISIEPESEETRKEYKNYVNQVSEEIEKQIGYFMDKPVYFKFDRTGAVKDVKIYNDYDLINTPILASELKKIRVAPYSGNLKNDTINVLYINNNSVRNIINYYNKKMAPVLKDAFPEINTLSLKPLRCLILMNKNGHVEEVTLIKSSGSQQIDKDTINAIKYNSYDSNIKSPTEKFVFEIEIYNLNKYLRQYYAKYAKTVASYTLGNVPNIGLHYMQTAKIFFTIKKDGKIKDYILFNSSGRVIREKTVEDNLKRLTFPEFPPNIDADELDILVDLYDPGNNAMTNIILNSTSIVSEILYMIIRGTLY